MILSGDATTATKLDMAVKNVRCTSITRFIFVGSGLSNVVIASDFQSLENESAVLLERIEERPNTSKYWHSTRLPPATPSSAGCRQTFSSTSSIHTRTFHRRSTIPKMHVFKQRLPRLLPLTPVDAASSHETTRKPNRGTFCASMGSVNIIVLVSRLH